MRLESDKWLLTVVMLEKLYQVFLFQKVEPIT